jgi:hypothetical protein
MTADEDIHTARRSDDCHILTQAPMADRNNHVHAITHRRDHGAQRLGWITNGVRARQWTGCGAAGQTAYGDPHAAASQQAVRPKPGERPAAIGT